MTLVWFATGSCTIIDALYNGTPLTQVPSYIPSDPNWDPDTGAVPSCALESGGHSVDIGIPIVFPAACSTDTPPADLRCLQGPGAVDAVRRAAQCLTRSHQLRTGRTGVWPRRRGQHSALDRREFLLHSPAHQRVRKSALAR